MCINYISYLVPIIRALLSLRLMMLCESSRIIYIFVQMKSEVFNFRIDYSYLPNTDYLSKIPIAQSDGDLHNGPLLSFHKRYSTGRMHSIKLNADFTILLFSTWHLLNRDLWGDVWKSTVEGALRNAEGSRQFAIQRWQSRTRCHLKTVHYIPSFGRNRPYHYTSLKLSEVVDKEEIFISTADCSCFMRVMYLGILSLQRLTDTENVVSEGRSSLLRPKAPFDLGAWRHKGRSSFAGLPRAKGVSVSLNDELAQCRR